MDKSFFGVLEIENKEARVKLYFFKKNGSEDLVEWDGEIDINFNNH